VHAARLVARVTRSRSGRAARRARLHVQCRRRRPRVQPRAKGRIAPLIVRVPVPLSIALTPVGLVIIADVAGCRVNPPIPHIRRRLAFAGPHIDVDAIAANIPTRTSIPARLTSGRALTTCTVCWCRLVTHSRSPPCRRDPALQQRADFVDGERPP
jgi:hypothetical protein